jgi:chorismate synthase
MSVIRLERSARSGSNRTVSGRVLARSIPSTINSGLQDGFTVRRPIGTTIRNEDIRSSTVSRDTVGTGTTALETEA